MPCSLFLSESSRLFKKPLSQTKLNTVNNALVSFKALRKASSITDTAIIKA